MNSGIQSGPAVSPVQSTAGAAPYDVLQNIFGYLMQVDRRSSVKASALVCRAWVEPTRKFLFDRFEVTFGNSLIPSNVSSKCDGLRDLITTLPHLSQYFQDVVILVPRKLSDIRSDDEEALCRLFQMNPFPNASSLYLSSYDPSMPRDRINIFSEISTSLLQSLQQLIGAPSFQRLYLCRWIFSRYSNELLDFLRHCAATLRVLAIDTRPYLSIAGGSQEVARERLELPRLRELQLIGPWSFSEEDFAVSMPRLQSFHRTIDTQAENVPSLLYRFISQSVDNLTIWYEYRANVRWPHRHLGLFHRYDNARHLRLVFPLADLKQLWHTNFSIVNRFLTQVPMGGLDRFESLTIEFAFNIMPFHHWYDCWDPHAVLSIDECLVHLVDYASLAKVVLVLKIGSYDGPDDIGAAGRCMPALEHLVRAIRAHVPGLLARKALEFRLKGLVTDEMAGEELGSNPSGV